MALTKKQSVLSKLNIKSRKSRFIILAVAFAAVGGAIVFQSHAATAEYHYNYYNSNLGGTAGDCRITRVSDIFNGKSTEVYNMACAAGAKNGPSLYSTGGYLGANLAGAGSRFKICAWVKGSGSVLLGLSGSSVDNGFPNSLQASFSPTNEYKYLCYASTSWLKPGPINLTISRNIPNSALFVNVVELVLVRTQ